MVAAVGEGEGGVISIKPLLTGKEALHEGQVGLERGVTAVRQRGQAYGRGCSTPVVVNGVAATAGPAEELLFETPEARGGQTLRCTHRR